MPRYEKQEVCARMRAFFAYALYILCIALIAADVALFSSKLIILPIVSLVACMFLVLTMNFIGKNDTPTFGLLGLIIVVLTAVHCGDILNSNEFTMYNITSFTAHVTMLLSVYIVYILSHAAKYGNNSNNEEYILNKFKRKKLIPNVYIT